MGNDRNQIITPDIKDKILSIIKERLSESSDNKIDFSYKSFSEVDIEEPEFQRLKAQLVQMGLIVPEKYFERVSVTASFDDFIYRGGFQFKELIFQANIEKLAIEVDKLKKTNYKEVIGIANNISSIASNLINLGGVIFSVDKDKI